MLEEWIRILGSSWPVLVVLSVASAVWIFKAEIKELILWIWTIRKRKKISLVMSCIREAGLHGIAADQLQEITKIERSHLHSLLEELEAAKRIYYHGGRWYLFTPRSEKGHSLIKDL